MSYQKLHEHFGRLGDLEHIAAILQWDEAVMMPAAAGAQRAEAMATLKRTMHALLVDPALPEFFAAAQQQATAGELDDWQSANLREMGHIHRRATCLPEDLVAARSKAQLLSEQAWRRLRADNDWASFLPMLKEVVALEREAAAILGEHLSLSPYDALMDEYEPGARAEQIDVIFADLRAFLPDFIQEVIERQSGRDVVRPAGPFPVELQRKLGLRLMRAAGLDEQRGRLDVSHHPFCGGVPSDVRITTRYDESDFSSALMGVLHETGHAKYEQGLPAAWQAQPVGRARGMAMHESQSLLLEMQISRSREFLQFAAPAMREVFQGQAAAHPKAFELDNLYALYTRVERSLIRVDADEVTYPCHILLRYDLERALFAGAMEVEDIPTAWDEGMQGLLGLRTEGDYRDGCMQDAHWPGGAFGYFPTYTLGAMIAAQLFAAARADNSELPAQIAAGELGPLDAFLRREVWSVASSRSTDEILRNATRAPLSTAAFKTHLQTRYLS